MSDLVVTSGCPNNPMFVLYLGEVPHLSPASVPAPVIVTLAGGVVVWAETQLRGRVSATKVAAIWGQMMAFFDTHWSIVS